MYTHNRQYSLTYISIYQCYPHMPPGCTYGLFISYILRSVLMRDKIVNDMINAASQLLVAIQRSSISKSFMDLSLIIFCPK